MRLGFVTRVIRVSLRPSTWNVTLTLNGVGRLPGPATPLKHPIQWARSSDTIEQMTIVELLILNSSVRAYDTCRDRRSSLRIYQSWDGNLGNEFTLT